MAAEPGLDRALGWRKSTASGESGSCIEVARRGSSVLVRDSRNPAGAILAFGPGQWAAFLGRIRSAEPGVPGSDATARSG